MEKHYSLDFLTDYYGDDVIAMKEVLQLYLQETPKDIDSIETHLKGNDAQQAKATTHKIKTNIAMLGISDPSNFVDAMHKLRADEQVTQEMIFLFNTFKSEVSKGLNDIEQDFFSKKSS